MTEVALVVTVFEDTEAEGYRIREQAIDRSGLVAHEFTHIISNGYAQRITSGLPDDKDEVRSWMNEFNSQEEEFQAVSCAIYYNGRMVQYYQ